MAMDPRLRCSDADREAIVADLREHYAAGRLTLEEFQQRSDTAYAARTFGDLTGLMDDLPALAVAKPEPSRVPVPAPQPQRSRGDALLRGPWAVWMAITILATVAWMIRGGYYWPIWIVGPWGLMMLMGSGRRSRMIDERHALNEQHRRLALEAERLKLQEKEERLRRRAERLDQQRADDD